MAVAQPQDRNSRQEHHSSGEEEQVVVGKDGGFLHQPAIQHGISLHWQERDLLASPLQHLTHLLA